MPPKTTTYREVGTHESTADLPKLNKSASRRTKRDLELLGVEYDYQEFESDIGVDDGDMPNELLESSILVYDVANL